MNECKICRGAPCWQRTDGTPEPSIVYQTDLRTQLDRAETAVTAYSDERACIVAALGIDPESCAAMDLPEACAAVVARAEAAEAKLVALDAFRAHLDFENILGNIVCDLQDGLDDSEAYEGESAARREGYQLLHVLLEGKRWEPACGPEGPDEEEDDAPERCVICSRPLSSEEAAHAAGACHGCIAGELS